MAILGVIKLATIANNAPIPNQKIKNPHSCNFNHEKNSSSNKPYIPHKNLLLNYYTINCIKKEEKNAKNLHKFSRNSAICNNFSNIIY